MDEKDFEELHRATAPALRLYLDRVCGDRRAAEDCLQETYLRFLRARTAPEDPEERRRYLFRVATNLVRDDWARSRRRAAFQGSQGDRREEGLAGGAVASDRAERLDLRTALGSLRPRDREILWLAYAEGCSHLEIAEILGVRPGSVRVLLFRARRKLLAVLARNPQGAVT